MAMAQLKVLQGCHYPKLEHHDASKLENQVATSDGHIWQIPQ
jgi:hypothetical protein